MGGRRGGKEKEVEREGPERRGQKGEEGEGKEKVERKLKEMSRKGCGRGGKSGPWFSLHSLHLGRERQIQEPLPTPEMSQKYHQGTS